MSTSQTYTITGSSGLIIITYSASLEVLHIPTPNLTINYKPSAQNERGDRVYLNWPAGNWHPGGRKELNYSDVTAPVLANNTALVAYLLSLMGTTGSDANGKIMIPPTDVAAYTNAVRGIEIRVDNTKIAAWIDEDGNNLVTDLALTNQNLLITDGKLFIPNGKRSANIRLTQGSIWLIL